MKDIEHLIELRKKKNISQRWVSQKLGFHQSAVSKWEAGRYSPSAELIGKWTQILNDEPVHQYRPKRRQQKPYDPDENYIRSTDDANSIQKCLECEKPFCDNCLGRDENSKWVRPYNTGWYIQIDPETGKEVARYTTGYKAADAVGVSQTTLSQCANGKRQTAGGYKWKREPFEEGMI